MLTARRLSLRFGLRRTIFTTPNVCCGISRDAVLFSTENDSVLAGSGRFYRLSNTSSHDTIRKMCCQSLTRSSRFVKSHVVLCCMHFKIGYYFCINSKNIVFFSIHTVTLEYVSVMGAWVLVLLQLCDDFKIYIPNPHRCIFKITKM